MCVSIPEGRVYLWVGPITHGYDSLDSQPRIISFDQDDNVAVSMVLKDFNISTLGLPHAFLEGLGWSCNNACRTCCVRL